MSEKNDNHAGIVIKGKKYTFRTILLVLVCLIVLTFIVLNWDSVTIHLIFADLQVRLAVLIFMTFGLGFFAGWLFQVMRKKKTKEKDKPEIIEADHKAIDISDKED